MNDACFMISNKCTIKHEQNWNTQFYLKLVQVIIFHTFNRTVNLYCAIYKTIAIWQAWHMAICNSSLSNIEIKVFVLLLYSFMYVMYGIFISLFKFYPNTCICCCFQCKLQNTMTLWNGIDFFFRNIIHTIKYYILLIWE